VRRVAWCIAALPAALLMGGAQAAAVDAAANYPSRPIRLLVGFAPGGTNDIIARLLAPKMSEMLGQQTVVDNRPGASTMLATELAVRAAPDGHTLLMNSGSHTANPSLAKPAYDSVRDFAFISMIAESQSVLLHQAGFPAQTVKDLIAHAKQRPGELRYSSPGVGSTLHLAAELFQYMTGVKWSHIPYKGGGPALVALLSGEVSLHFANIPVAIPHIRDGRLRAMALSGSKRTPLLPAVAPLADSGLPGFDVTSWFGVAAPAKTPRAVVEKLHATIVRSINAADLRARLADQGADPVGNTPAQYTAFIQNEIAKWAKVIKAAGIRGE
jgi:tripartite-type tricarboxylate transporter receptor subunit TctC